MFQPTIWQLPKSNTKVMTFEDDDLKYGQVFLLKRDAARQEKIFNECWLLTSPVTGDVVTDETCFDLSDWMIDISEDEMTPDVADFIEYWSENSPSIRLKARKQFEQYCKLLKSA